MSCASQVVQNIQDGEGGWESGRPVKIVLSHGGFEGPCIGCEDVLQQLASNINAPVQVEYNSPMGPIALPPYWPGIVLFGE